MENPNIIPIKTMIRYSTHKLMPPIRQTLHHLLASLLFSAARA